MYLSPTFNYKHFVKFSSSIFSTFFSCIILKQIQDIMSFQL